MNLFKPGLSSRKTTAAALMTVVSLIMGAVSAMTDGNPDTNPDWNVIMPAIFIALGLLFSRDADKSSEASGVN